MEAKWSRLADEKITARLAVEANETSFFSSSSPVLIIGLNSERDTSTFHQLISL